jgi:hypothetical protein
MDGELEQLGERIAEHAAHFDAAMHRLLADLREFDQRGGWHVQGARSCAHWLAWRVGWDLVTARERVRVAGKLGELPSIDNALRTGEISYSKVRAMVRVATSANEQLLLGHAQLMTGSQLEKLCRKYALVQRHYRESSPRDDQERRYVRRRDTEDADGERDHQVAVVCKGLDFNNLGPPPVVCPAPIAARPPRSTGSLVRRSPLDHHDNPRSV